MVDGVWPGKGLKVTEAPKVRPERFEHMREGSQKSCLHFRQRE